MQIHRIIALLLLFPASLCAQSSKTYLLQIGTLDSIQSIILGETRNIYVQLPDTYTPQAGKRYPVIFLLDGEILLPTLHAVHQSYYGGFLPESILIGISNEMNRTRDLTPSEVKPFYGTQETGEAERFSKFIAQELIPHVEEKYPVSNYRTLIGHSYAGLFTIYSLLNHPELFTNYLAIDPSMDWDEQKFLKETISKLPQMALNGKSLFMSLSGQLHMADPSVTIENLMQDSTDFTLFARSNLLFSQKIRQHEANGLHFDWQFYPNDLHGTVPLPSIMDGLIALFEWFQMEDTHLINDPNTSKEKLAGIIEHRAQKLEAHFAYQVPPYPENLLNISAYMSMDRNQMEKAKMYFDFAIQFYPQSANVYDSMADYYIAKEDYQQAYDWVSKAYAISKSQYHKKRMEELGEKR